MTATAYGRTFEPDHAMAFDGKHPFIPGSSLRGPLAHALSRELRRRGVPVEDPNVSGPDGPGAPMAEKEVRDLRAQYFGTVTRSARVLVRDAYLEEGAGWTAALLNHHAEDEFAGGPFESAKFTSLAVLAGRFGWRMVVECPDKAALVQAGGVVAALVGTVGNKDGLASLGMVPLGGRKWRGAGWAPWSVLSADEVALAPGFAAVPVAPPTSGGATPGARPVPRTAPRGVAKPPPPPPGAQPASCALQPSPVAGGTGALSLASLRAAVGNDAVVGYWLEPDPLDSARRGLPRGGPCMAAGPLPAEFECALLEARVFLGDGWVHLVSDGGTWRGVRMREVPGDAVTATTGHVVRLRDALRFGASVGALPEWLRWRRYEQGGRLVGWRLVANTEQQGRN
ncbi:MAG: hypothetical protein FJ102_21375 [Deltaproteobacteria bacterium]|nr:hypothetical protein [Deltaproteobacteria bacterium]